MLRDSGRLLEVDRGRVKNAKCPDPVGVNATGTRAIRQVTNMKVEVQGWRNMPQSRGLEQFNVFAIVAGEKLGVKRPFVPPRSRVSGCD